MGDCDYDADCKSGMSCFQRDGVEMVPGCSGDGVGGYDYCVLPELAIISAGGCGAGGCDVCKGDCDYDADCKSGLSCFHREGGEMVPGCSGDGVGRTDYCIAP
eukprot:scaffold70354_cov72-Phaeocystis_antarctica.AAC.2